MVLEELNVGDTLPIHKCYIKYINENALQFFKKEQIFFVVQERMFKDVPGQIKTVYNFIGAMPQEEASFYKFQRYSNENKYKDINYDSKNYPRAIKKLMDLYKPCNEELFQFLDDRIPEWNEFDQFYRKFI